ncbi:hypothetical protein JNUCC64_07485 [Streptomyces sp. JNUCC 64]
MSVFTRFFRRSKEAVDPAEAVTAPEPAAPAAEPAPVPATDAPAAKASDGSPAPSGCPVTAGADAGEAVEVLEIPQQQSAERAADNETGEGARR